MRSRVWIGFFRMVERQEDRWRRVALVGELDMASAGQLENRLSQLRAERIPVRLDLSRLAFMDLKGLSVLLDSARHAKHDGWDFSIDANCGTQVARLLWLTGVDRLLSHDG